MKTTFMDAHLAPSLSPPGGERVAEGRVRGFIGSIRVYPCQSVVKMNSWLLLNSGKCDPAFNMALDEALLEAASRLGQPVLRFYGWTEPAATFGYFQKYAEVERATLLRPLIRRPTGGGIVPHDADWTYSLVFPPDHEWHSLKAEESYRRIHEWIQSGVRQIGRSMAY